MNKEIYEIIHDGQEQWIVLRNRRFYLNTDRDNFQVSDLDVLGRDDKIKEVMSALVGHYPFNPLIIGNPGVGKTAFVSYLGQSLGKNLFVITGQKNKEESEFGYFILPPDPEHKFFDYRLSKLATAMITGNWIYVDEIAKLSPSCLDILITVTDHRRRLELLDIGLSLQAHPDFRFICSSNTGEQHMLQSHIRSRLKPVIQFNNLEISTLNEIIKNEFRNSQIKIEKAIADFWSIWFETQPSDKLPTPREVIQFFNYACNLSGHDHLVKEKGQIKSLNDLPQVTQIQESDIRTAMTMIFLD
jgi:MoxR-like ATPase